MAGLRSHDNYHCVGMGDGTEYSARALLLASGSRYRRLEVPGEDRFIGAGIHFCATCDGPFYRGRRVLVVGGGNSAAEESLFLAGMAEHVTILVRGSELRASKVIQDNVRQRPNIAVRFRSEVVGFDGRGGKLQTVPVRDARTGSTEVLQADGVFVFIGLTPNTAFLRATPVLLDRWGFVVTGPDLLRPGGADSGNGERRPTVLETSVPGIFAAGDVRAGSTKQVASAAGEGATAALLIREYLKHG